MARWRGSMRHGDVATCDMATGHVACAPVHDAASSQRVASPIEGKACAADNEVLAWPARRSRTHIEGTEPDKTSVHTIGLLHITCNAKVQNTISQSFL